MGNILLYREHLPRIAALAATVVFIISCYFAVTLLTDTGPAEVNAAETAPQNGKPRSPALSGKENYALISGWHLFGNPQKKAVKPQPAQAPETRLKLELLGVFFDKETKEGWAIIAEQGKPQKSYKIGDQLSGNVVIQSIEPDSVILERNKRRESLSLKKLIPR